MKKIILTLITIGSITATQAQENSLLIFGNLGFSMTNDGAGNKTTNFNINPGVGYQFTENLTAGIKGGYGMMKLSGDKPINYSVSVTSYDIGAFFRYTKPLGNIFCTYIQLDGGYMSNGDTGVFGAKGFNVGLTPAVGINVCSGFALNFGFGGLSFESSKPGGAGSSMSTINLTFGHQVNIGVSKNISFGMKHKGHHEPMEETRKLDTSDDDAKPAPAPKKKTDDDDE